MSHVSDALRRLVVDRAGNRCEYCGLSQQSQEATFHIDHVLPRVDGGITSADNLALACVSCSLRKGARRVVRDPVTEQIVPIFNPRVSGWHDHFRWNGVVVDGTTATGQATVDALQLNRPLILAIRSEEMALGRHPPPGPPMP